MPAQIHSMDADPFFVDEGDVDATRTLVAEARHVQFFYPGREHLFSDVSLPSSDEDATTLLLTRVLAFLRTVGN